MFKKSCILLVFLLSSLILGCSQQESKSLAIPSQYQHAQHILDQLSSEGLTITQIGNSKYTSFFNTNPDYSMYVTTDMGIFELVHLEPQNDKKIEIITKEATDHGEYKYVVKVNDEEQLVIEGSENFFNQTDEYITISRDKDLNKKIERALRTL